MFLRLQQKAVPESKASPLGNCAHTTPQRPRMRHWPWFSDENMLLVSEKGWVVPSGASGKEPACQCRGLKRHRFDPWVGKFPRRRATHSSIRAWRTPWAEEPSGVQSIAAQRVGHD